MYARLRRRKSARVLSMCALVAILPSACSDQVPLGPAELEAAASGSRPASFWIDHGTLTGQPGDTLRVRLKTSSGRGLSRGDVERVRWRVAHPAVATVEDGLVTFLSPGTTAVWADLQGQSATATVESVWAGISLDGLRVRPDTVTASVGESVQLAGELRYSSGVTLSVRSAPTWTSLDDSVATVKGGLVKAKSPGIARIVARMLGVTDTALVSVASIAPVLTALVLTPKTVTIQTGAKQQFAVSAMWSNGDTARPPVSFSATGGTITSDGLYTAGASAGTFQVVARHVGGGRADTTTVTVVSTPPALRTLGDREFFTQGQYGAYASPWSTFYDSTLRQGVDFSDSIVVNLRSFPDSSSIRWHWPNRQSTRTGVWGYMTIWYGNYDGGEPTVRVTPRQVKNITTLRQEYSLSYTSAGSFNILNEFYLTSAAGNPEAKVIEIGYLLHSAPEGKHFFDTGRLLGSYRDVAGRLWEARIQGKFCMVKPAGGEDVLSGSIDVHATLAFLVGKGVISGNEWFNGIAMGVEPIRGSGQLNVGRWTVTYH